MNRVPYGYKLGMTKYYEMRHPGEHAEGMSNFVSTQDYNNKLLSCSRILVLYLLLYLKLNMNAICKQISEWSPTQFSDDDLKL